MLAVGNIGGIGRLGLAAAISRIYANVFAGAAAAYSLRIPGGSTYSGPLIRARRSTDNAELDIGAVAIADINGDRWLDTSALLAFAGAGSAFDTTWYDQSGNGRHATQADPAAQPRIVNGGVLDAENSKPSIFGGGAQFLISDDAAYWSRNITNGTNSVVLRRTVGTDFRGVIGAAGPTGLSYLEVATAGTALRVNTRTTPVAIDTFNVGGVSNLSVATTTATPSSLKTFVNGLNVSDLTGNAATPVAASSGLGIFSRNPLSTSSVFIGSISEVVLFKDYTLPDAARIMLERSQGAAFGITIA